MLILVALAREEEPQRREEGQHEHRGRVQHKALHRRREHEEGAHRGGGDELGGDEPEHLRGRVADGARCAAIRCSVLPVPNMRRRQVPGVPCEETPAALAHRTMRRSRPSGNRNPSLRPGSRASGGAWHGRRGRGKTQRKPWCGEGLGGTWPYPKGQKRGRARHGKSCAHATSDKRNGRAAGAVERSRVECEAVNPDCQMHRPTPTTVRPTESPSLGHVGSPPRHVVVRSAEMHARWGLGGDANGFIGWLVAESLR